MSTTVQVLSHLPSAVVSGVPMAATSGILDWASAKIAQLEVVFKAFSIVAGIGFVIWQAVSSRGAMARIIISGLAAGVFVWIVWNVTSLQDRVGNEVSMGPAVVQESGVDATGASSLPADRLTDWPPAAAHPRLPARAADSSAHTAAPGLSPTAAVTAPWPA